MIINVDNDITLELTSVKHAAALFETVNQNRPHLSRFLPWVHHMQQVDDFTKYLQHCELLYAQKSEVSFVIFYQARAVGRIGIHYIHSNNQSGAIGYWLSKDAEGKGIMLRCCRKIIRYGFEHVGLHRIEIKAAVANTRSQALPEKLHFVKEGIMRQAEFVNGEFVDLVLYALLRQEWEAQ